MRPGHRRAGGEQDQRVEQRQVPGIEGLDALGRPHAAGDRNPRHVLQFIGEQRGVEIGPEPGDEEHHLRGDEQDHAVAMRDLHHAGMVVLDLGLENDVPPPADHGVEDADRADAEDDRRVSDQMVHPQDQPDRGDEGRGCADRRPRAGIDQVVIVVRSGMCIGHRHLLHLGATLSRRARRVHCRLGLIRFIRIGFRVQIFRCSMILSENRVPLFGISSDRPDFPGAALSAAA